jgi:MFS family permease
MIRGAEKMQATQEVTAKETPSSDPSYLNRLLLLFVGLVFITFYVEMMLVSSLLAIATEFGTSISQVSLVVALYGMSGTALVPVIGKLGDIYGKKRVLVIVLAAYATFVSVTGFSPSFNFMLVARTLQGIGIAIFPLLFSLVREQFPREKIPKAVGILSGMNGIGLAVALPLGSLISNDYGWRFTYHTAIPFVFLLAVLTYLLVRESPYNRPKVKIDYVGALLLGLSLASVVLALGEGATWGWTSVETLSLGSFGVALLFPLLLYERRYQARGGEPILNLRLLAVRNVMVTNLVILGLLGLTLAQVVYVFRLELPPPVGFGQSIFSAGLSLVPFALSMLIFAPLTGVVVSKVGVKPMAILGSLVAAVGFVYAAQTTGYAGLVASAIVVGAGLSTTLSAVQSLLLLTVEPRDMGLAAALNTVFRYLGNSIGGPIAGSVLTTFTVSLIVGKSSGGSSIYKAFPSVAAFQYTFYIAAAVFAGIIVVTFFAHEVLGHEVLGG